MMKFYFDNSINTESNDIHNVCNGIHLENDIMLDINKFSPQWGLSRTYDYKKADIIITNSFYEESVLNWSIKNSIPKIKRMDGIYWKNNLKWKNNKLNLAAEYSDGVIFISEYSKRALFDLYKIIPKNHKTILNDVNGENFYPKKNKLNNKFTSISSATNWYREEKRLESIIKLANQFTEDQFILMGKCEIELPKNVICSGWVDNKDKMNEILNRGDIFISPYFRDAGSKTTCQAIKSGLPVLYTTSGGLPELVKTGGVSILDYNEIDFLDETKPIDILNEYIEIKKIYRDIIPIKRDYYELISDYFKYILSFI